MTCRVFQTCKNNSNHVLYRFVPTATSYVKDADATCDEPEKGRYMATFYDDEYDFPIQYSEQFIVGEKLGHSYSAPVYTWNDTTCTATITCVHDSTHVITETAQGNYVKDTDATCDEPEKGHYEVTFVNEDFGTKKTQINSFSMGVARGHKYGEPIYEWEHGQWCRATRICEYDNNHKQTETKIGVYYKDTDATCEKPEKGHYEVVFENKDFSTQKTQLNSASMGVPIGHKYGEPVYEWEHGQWCRATRICEYDNNHKETEMKRGTYYKDTDSTCEEPEKGHYEVTFNNHAFASQRSAQESVGVALGHNYGAWSSNDNNTHTRVCINNSNHTETKNCSGGTATCSERATCTECNAKHGELLQHNYGAWSSNDNNTHTRVCVNNSNHTETKDCSGGTATCTEKATCQVCNGKHGVLLDHKFIKEVVASEYKNLDATCQKKATYFYSCYCGEKGNKTFEYGDVGDHNFIYGECMCGEIDTSYMTKGLIFQLMGEEYFVTHYTGTESKVIIPSIYRGKIVTTIDNAAFQDCNILTNIIIPNSLVTICADAFARCKSLSKIEIPSSVKTIDDRAFLECDMLLEMNYLGTIDEWVEIEFGSDCSNPTYFTKELHINNNLVTNILLANATKISSYAFYNCNSIVSVTISNSVKSIGSGAFFGCNSIEKSNYLGNINQWVQIDFGGNWSNPTSYVGDLYINNILVKEVTLSADKISSYAFYNCRQLSTIIMPNVISIGISAFSYCVELKNVQIPNGVTKIEACTFLGCKNLKEVILPQMLDSIGYSAFARCNLLNNVAIPNSVTNIGDYAFEGCSSFTSIIIPSKVEFMGSNVFSGVLNSYIISNFAIYCEISEKPINWKNDWNYYNLPVIWNCKNNDVAEDGYVYVVEEGVRYALKDGVAKIIRQSISIKDVKVKSTITFKGQVFTLQTIETESFKGCNFMESISLPFVGGNRDGTGKTKFAFLFTSLTFVDYRDMIPSSLKTVIVTDAATIPDEAFSQCEMIENIILSDSIINIGERAFYDCKSLKNITLSSKLTNIGAQAFYGCKSLEGINIPSEVISMGQSVFQGCTSLKQVVFEENIQLKEISNYAFAHCEALEKINIPNGLVSIGEMAFRDCKALKKVLIPNSVKNIGYMAFCCCINLEDVYIPASVETIDGWVFSGDDLLTIYCQVEKVNMPATWDYNWNPDNRPVVWGYTGA